MTDSNDIEIPIKGDLSTIMDISIIVKENGDPWIVHDKPFDETPNWVEFDNEDKSIILVTQNGNIHKVDLSLQPLSYQRLLNAKRVFLIFMKDGKTLEEIKELPVITRDI